MKSLAAGKKGIREHPEMLERWFGRSGIYHTGGINTATTAAPPIPSSATQSGYKPTPHR